MTLPSLHTVAPGTPPHRSEWSGRRVLVPLALLGALISLALAAPWLSPAPPNEIAVSGLAATAPPSWAHPFGLDTYGRDVLSRVLHGARVSLAVATLSVTLAALVGVVYGTFAAWAGGWVDAALMRLLDVALSTPRLLLLLCVTALWGTVSVTGLVLLLGVTGWFDIARLVRGEVRAILTRDFTAAARATGVPAPRLLWRHVTPHLIPTLAVWATLAVANAIALEAGLSYLSLGVQPPHASWGNILLEATSGFVRANWWMVLFPGLAIVITALACNALGDALRDQFAPRQVGA